AWSETTSIEGGPPHAAERPRVGNFDEQNWGISASAVIAEHWALRNRLRRVSGLYELPYDGRLYPFRAIQAGFTLGGDRVSVGIDVYGGVHLALRRYAQVQDRLRLDAKVKLGGS
ncbi:hypothetical protein PFZ49_16200, partial [Microbacterium lacticum]